MSENSEKQKRIKAARVAKNLKNYPPGKYWCNYCPGMLDISAFTACGLTLSKCRVCCSKYYQENKNEILSKRKQEYFQNPSKFKAKRKKYYQENTAKVKEQSKSYKENNKSYYSNYNSLYRESHRDELILYGKNYREENAEQLRVRKREYQKNILEKDITYLLKKGISRQISLALKKQGAPKNGQSTLKFLPYSILDLKFHLQNQFEPWMTWENWGVYNPKTWDDDDPATWVWNIDHIVPHSTFHYETMDCEEFRKCWALENLRPLNAKQNILDGIYRIRHIKNRK